MKKIVVVLGFLALMSVSAKAETNLKWYGFIRNYFVYDSRENWSGTADLFTYMPKDVAMSGDIDTNANPHFTYSAITSRLGVDVSGYEYNGWKIGAKIEADFYAGLTGVSGTATMRLRQAFVSIANGNDVIKIGQAWHPMAADMPDVFSLNTGAPFGAFARNPLVQFDTKISDKLSCTAALLWQMQYTSAGPDGAKADYMKYGLIPELYAGISFKDSGFLARLGVDYLNIAPRMYKTTILNGKVRANERKQSVLGFAYLSYTKDLLSIKYKTTYGQGGEHLNLISGYAASMESIMAEGLADQVRDYVPYTHTSSWMSIRYGKKLQSVFFLGFYKNLGTSKAVDPSTIYYYKNASYKINQAYRIAPEIVYNFGKLALGLQYELTAAQYGDGSLDDNGLCTNNLHWVENNRVQMMVKYTF